MEVKIERLSNSTKFFVREELNYDLIEHYSELLATGIKLPPITVLEDKQTDSYTILDGFHTYHTAEKTNTDCLNQFNAPLDSIFRTREDQNAIPTQIKVRSGIAIKVRISCRPPKATKTKKVAKTRKESAATTAETRNDHFAFLNNATPTVTNAKPVRKLNHRTNGTKAPASCLAIPSKNKTEPPSLRVIKPNKTMKPGIRYLIIANFFRLIRGPSAYPSDETQIVQ